MFDFSLGIHGSTVFLPKFDSLFEIFLTISSINSISTLLKFFGQNISNAATMLLIFRLSIQRNEGH